MSEADATPVVLYVDDEPINLRVFEANFRSRFRTVTCKSGQEALALLTQRAQEVAVVISDQRMPGMSGVEFLEQARSVAPDVRRMLITAYSDMQAVMDAVNRGQVVRYFVKPWSKDELGAAIEDAVGIFRLQTQLRDIQARMLHSERLAVLGQVSAGIAHELMNPVSYVTQNVATLRREFETLAGFLVQRGLHAEVRQTLEELPSILSDLETGAQHIRRVALAVRSQAHGEDQEAITAVHEVAELAVKIARAEVGQRARVQTRGEPMMVRLGPVKLSQVLINLILNAAHAIPDERQPGLIDVTWRAAEDHHAHVYVRDNGHGMPADVLSRAFEPLFTTKPAGTGTGLGLPICKSIVEAAGGSIRLSSAVDEGTTVELTLPLV